MDRRRFLGITAAGIGGGVASFFTSNARTEEQTAQLEQPGVPHETEVANQKKAKAGVAVVFGAIGVVSGAVVANALIPGQPE